MLVVLKLVVQFGNLFDDAFALLYLLVISHIFHSPVQIINGTSLYESVIELRKWPENTYDDAGPSVNGRDRGEARLVRSKILGWYESVICK